MNIAAGTNKWLTSSSRATQRLQGYGKHGAILIGCSDPAMIVMAAVLIVLMFRSTIPRSYFLSIRRRADR
jgi:hypothetical protein